jgi:glycosyltransferase involved in cell wall biosynthesis
VHEEPRPENPPASRASREIMRVAVIAEELSPRADEGALKFLGHLLRRLCESHEVLALHMRGNAPDGIAARRVRIPRFTVGSEMRRHLAPFDADLVLYVPSAAATINALWRFRRLERAFPRSRMVLVSTQHREYRGLGRVLVPWLRPSRLLVMSTRSARAYAKRGWVVEVVSMGVDLERFRPARDDERASLRAALGWPPDQRVVLHVGHLRHGRGLERLAEVAGHPGTHVVMVASSSMPAEDATLRQLERAGVEIRRGYDPHVERFYQAADVYLFPVVDKTSAIEFPLSVLEALACDLPVVSTRFGSLPEHFRAGEGLEFLDGDAPVLDAVEAVLRQPRRCRPQAAELSWDRSMDRLLDACLASPRSEG